MASVSTMGGCALFGEPRVTSPYSQRPVTAAELAAEHEAKLRALEVEDRAEQERLDAEAQAAQREFDSAIARLDLDNQQALIDLRSQFAGQADQIAAERLKQQRERESESQRLAGLLAQGRAELERQREQADLLGGVLGTAANDPGIGAAVASVPLVGGLLTGVLGWARGNINARKAREEAEDKARQMRDIEHEAWDEAKADADEAQRKADKLWDESQAAAKLDAMQAAMLQLTARLASLAPAPAPTPTPAIATTTNTNTNTNPPAGPAISAAPEQPAASA